MNNKFSTITIQKPIDSSVPGGIDCIYRWVGSNDGIVIVSDYFLAGYNNDLNNYPELPWKMKKIKNDVYETWWIREEYVADRVIQLEEEISKLKSYLNMIYTELGNPVFESEEIRKWTKEVLSRL